MSSPSAKQIGQGCAVLFLLIIGGCFTLVLIGSNAKDREAARKKEELDRAVAALPEAMEHMNKGIEAAKAAQAAELVPGTYYQVNTTFRLQSAMSNLQTAKDAAMVVPSGGIFLFNGLDTQFEGTWWNSTVLDGSGVARTGYIDGSSIPASSIRPYQASESANTATQTKSPQRFMPNASKAGDVFVSTGQGEKYHRKQNCPSISRSNVISISVGEAANRGFAPCELCYGR